MSFSSIWFCAYYTLFYWFRKVSFHCVVHHKLCLVIRICFSFVILCKPTFTFISVEFSFSFVLHLIKRFLLGLFWPLVNLSVLLTTGCCFYHLWNYYYISLILLGSMCSPLIFYYWPHEIQIHSRAHRHWDIQNIQGECCV